MAKKNLFGWMFVEDEQSQKPAESVKKEPIPAAPPVTPTTTPVIPASTDVDSKLVEHLERKINEANLPGPDYLELLQAAEQMKMYIPDETTRLKAAFGSIQAVIDVKFDGRRTDAIRQTTAFADYVKQIEQIMSETHE